MPRYRKGWQNRTQLGHRKRQMEMNLSQGSSQTLTLNRVSGKGGSG
ncbi:hypothetical protein NP493_200g02021 [Ridgeia piscesae]|uniref:Uncharacterized protein n=1 Tax=Ridgeia piscesae TaxID=27915 RepID=A0AAD9UEK5_RIDPI|nr:hypothetical protein NP493_200g02021 [Ridgeia piscesae]